MNDLYIPITRIKGIGPKSEERFAGAGLYTLGDLVTYYPRRYDALGEIGKISEAADGQILAVCGHIEGKLTLRYAGRFKIVTGRIRTDSEVIPVTWFNMPYLAKSIRPDQAYVFRGYVKEKGKTLRLSQPALYEPAQYELLRRHLQPVYPLPGGLKEGTLKKAIAGAFSLIGKIPETLPGEILGAYDLMGEDEALRAIHFPDGEEQMQRARRRLVFDEFLLFILALRRLKSGREQAGHSYEMPRRDWADQALASLPYRLTGAQQRVWESVERDMCARKVMARLVQGDVGSGKTVIAFLALIKAVENGGQGALMVPTEVLARQHYEAFLRLCDHAGLSIRAGLLTGGLTPAAKRRMHEEIETGQVQVIIGTHALISEKVSYRDLKLAVTDEQHRFGVRQREHLQFKGQLPHVLVMSATPIPRTLAVILYGDLDVSVIDELPGGRLPIKNCVVNPAWRAKAYAFIRREALAGHQAYVICPMVEESEELEASNVIDYAETLRSALPKEITVEYLHGKMKNETKNQIMERFVSGQIRVLVSTTVVEVGVNVPNATVMMVEDAQRFGLAQLHQLRGRVGRGDAQSYCILVNTAPDGANRRRLEIMNSSNDGFEIARKDLELRGPGDLFGIRQSGLIDFKIGDVFSDASVLQYAGEAADQIIDEDAGLSSEKYRGLREKLQSYMRGGEVTINI